MFQRILLCVDGSDQALNTTQFVLTLISDINTHVDVVHLFDHLVAEEAVEQSYLLPESLLSEEAALQEAQEAQQKLLQGVGEILNRASVSHQIHAEFGNHIQPLHEIASRAQADLIVLDSRVLSAWPALLLGSISERVAAHMPCPVLVIRGAPERFERIIIGTDVSLAAGHALRVGMELAREWHAGVSVVNVFQPDASYTGVPRYTDHPEVYASLVEKAVAYQVDPIAKEVGIPVRIYQRRGRTAEALITFAEQQRADLIVVGTRELGGIHWLLAGTVSTNLLYHSHCSLLIVR